MQEVFNWFYIMTANIFDWLFSMQIVENVSIGMFMILAIMSSLVAANLIRKAKA